MDDVVTLGKGKTLKRDCGSGKTELEKRIKGERRKSGKKDKRQKSWKKVKGGKRNKRQTAEKG